MSRSALAAAALMFAPAPALAQTAAPDPVAPMTVNTCPVAPMAGYYTNTETGNGGFAWRCGQDYMVLPDFDGEMTLITPAGRGLNIVNVARQGANGVCVSSSLVGIRLVADGLRADGGTRFGFFTNAQIAEMQGGAVVSSPVVEDPRQLPAEAADCGATQHGRINDVVNYMLAVEARALIERAEAARRNEAQTEPAPVQPPRQQPVRIRPDALGIIDA